eukprot:jgi/Mesvir1/25388/Mv01427-RA.1
MSKRLSTQRSLAAALSNENTSAAPAAASPTGPEGSGATSQALVVAQPPLAASPAASPEPKRSRPAEPTWEEFDFDASQPGFFDKLNPDKILSYVFFGSYASLLEMCKQLFHQGRLTDAFQRRTHPETHNFDHILKCRRPHLQIRVLFSLLGRSLEELWPPKPLTTTLTESSIRSLLKEALEQHVAPIAADVAVMGSTLAAELPLLSTATSTISTATSTLLASSTATPSTSDAITAQLRDIDQRLKDNAIAIEVLQNTAGLTAQAVKDIAAKPASAGLAGDAPPITTWADMLKQHTTSTTSAVAAQLQRQTLDLREEAELAKRSLNVIVKNFKMEEGPPPLLLTFKTPADKISFLRRRKRLEKTLFTLDDDLTLAQQQRRRELWPAYLQLRQTKAGQPVYWKGAAIYVGHKPWQATPPPPRPQRLQTPQLRGIQQ